MNFLNLKKFYILLFSVIPLTIIIGPSLSLTNILLLGIIFLIYLPFEKKNYFLKDQTFILLICIYFYLIFNSLVAVDFDKSMPRNFGFLRFILFFLFFNFYVYKFNNLNSILFIWTITIFIVIFDSYVEIFYGKNLLGYGEIYKERVVSFFKDEPIVGGYLNGFLFIIVGYLFQRFFERELKFKIILFFLIILLIACVIFTGERSNGIKALFGTSLFFLLNQKIDLRNKIISILLISCFSLVLIFNSDYLKIRYGDQLFSKIIDKDQRKQFIDGNLYLKLYKSGYAVFKDYPIFGVGNKNYRVVTTNNVSEKVNENYFVSTHPHQFYFEVLSEHGLIGSLIFLSLLFYLVFKYLNVIIFSKNDIQLGCFIYLIINFLPILPSGSFFGDFNSTLFWINLSLMYACNPKTNIFKNYN